MATLAFRRRLGIGQNELGTAISVSASVVSQLESGKKCPSYETIKKLLELGATVEELFGVDYEGLHPKSVPSPENTALTVETVNALIQFCDATFPPSKRQIQAACDKCPDEWKASQGLEPQKWLDNIQPHQWMALVLMSRS